jgi:predicted transcriptional regulator
MSRDLLRLVAQIVSSHASGNSVTSLTEAIKSVYATLNSLADGTTVAPTGSSGSDMRSPGLEPAVPIENSVFPEYIICLEDGKQLTMLKRHLMVLFNMTPEAYRERWGLPRDYPMTAPSYVKRRSEMARQFGLGHKPLVAAGKQDVTERDDVSQEALGPSGRFIRARAARKRGHPPPDLNNTTAAATPRR